MAALFDQAKLNKDGTRRVELYEDNALWLIDGEKSTEIKLASGETVNLLAFLKQWETTIHQREREAEAEREQVCICAQQQARHDIPYVEVGEARLYQYHETSGRWYVEVDLQHHDPDEGAAVALYRVWRSPLGLAAFKVDIREAESE